MVNLHIEILAREEGGILEIKIRICGDFAKEGRGGRVLSDLKKIVIVKASSWGRESLLETFHSLDFTRRIKERFL